MDALEAGPFTICFCNIKPPVYFALRRVVLRSGKRLRFFRVNTARDLALERSTFSMLQLHLFSGPTSFIHSTNGSANLPRPSGCGFFHAERRAPS